MKTVKENARKERKNPNEIATVQPTDKKKKKKKKTLHRVSKRKKPNKMGWPTQLHRKL